MFSPQGRGSGLSLRPFVMCKCVCVFSWRSWWKRLLGRVVCLDSRRVQGGPRTLGDILRAETSTKSQGEETAVEEARQVGGPGGVAPRTFGEGFGHGKPGSDRSCVAHWRRGAGAGAQGKGERQPSS